MKKLKLIALALALITLSLFVAACSGGAEKVKVKVTVVVLVDEVEDGAYFGPVEVEVEGDVENPPTILQCLKEAFILNDMAYEDDGLSIISIGNYKEKTEGEYTYFWDYKINQEPPTAGRAGTIVANDGDLIVFTFVKESTADLAAAEDANED